MLNKEKVLKNIDKNEQLNFHGLIEVQIASIYIYIIAKYAKKTMLPQ